ncbi:YheV family putative zinc ribbon protein [Vibrio aerogenes]|uniref:YheV family putative zinc ribbon protein n=1 Tax=Vibrio aerogenes TaxID=92172 RepID=UPI000936CE3C|nr:YheV family putative zinc ribbon protein [Vibrio aerogenes]
MRQKKRFIAGANCPKCSGSDSLCWWVENNVEHVECVDCGFTEQRLPKGLDSGQRNQEQMIGIFKPE